MTHAQEWSAGLEIGRYRLVRLLGCGGMGEVWEALDGLLGRRVAVKRVTGARVDDGARQRLLREAQALASVRSPRVVALHDVIPATPPLAEPAVVMELVSGHTLRDLLAASGPLPVERALHLFRQLAEGLAAAHAAGVLHRDLKPANVIVRPDDTLVVLDFGLAVLQSAEGVEARELTATGAVMGTAEYMAPEQVRGLRPSTQTDIWAAGVVLYEMLTGRRPFEGPTLADRTAALLRDEPRPVSDGRPEVPEAVRLVVEACLQKDPADRPRDGTRLLERLPLETLPLAQPARLLAIEAIAAGRAHAPLSRRAAMAALALGIASAALLTHAAVRSWPSDARQPLPRLAAVRQQAAEWVQRLGLPPAAYVAEGYLSGPMGELQTWARGSRTDLLHPDQPPSLDFPGPTPGAWRARRHVLGRLRSWEHWPDGPPHWSHDRLLAQVLAEAGLPATPLVPRGEAERGAPLLVGRAGSEEVRVAQLGGHLLRFEAGPTQAAGPVIPRSLPLDAALAVSSAILLVVNVRAHRVDLRGALALATLATVLQLLKLVLNPVTFVSGIWVDVVVEAFGRGVQVLLAYLAFEPVVRRHWPGLLAGWARLAALRRPDEHVGRELLLGLAALAPLALALELLGGLVPGWLPEPWRNLCLFGLDRWGYHAFVLLDVAQSGIEFAALLLTGAAVLLVLGLRPPVALPLATLGGCLAASGSGEPWPLGLGLTVASSLAALAWRGGLLAMGAYLVGAALCFVAVPLETGAWTLPFSLAGMAATVLLAGWGYRLATAGWRPTRSTPASGLETLAADLAPTRG